MPRRLYRALLRILPARRRTRFGEEMEATFDAATTAARRDGGTMAVGRLWMKEVGGLVKFSIRDRLYVLKRSGLSFSFATELRLATRSVRARGWHGAFIVVLLGVAMAAMTVVFSAADSFVFRRAPYPDPGSLVVMRHTRDGRVSAGLPGPVIVEWSKQRDLFDAVHGYQLGGRYHVTTGDVTDVVAGWSVSPGLLEMLGGTPKWGRPLMPDDAKPGARPVVVIGEEIARRLTGDPGRAVGTTLKDADSSVEIVGVLPEAFKFPTARERIWMPFDVSSGSTYEVLRNYTNIARLAPGTSFDAVRAAVAARAPTMELASPRPDRRRVVTLERYGDTIGDVRASTIFMMLIGAAACLLFIACANVVSLELAGALRRSRIYAIHAALGASRITLSRIALLEGGLLLLLSAASAAALSWWGTATLTTSLPPTLSQQLSNGIDLDARAVAFMVVAAATTWLLTSLPLAWRASRANVTEALKHDSRVIVVSRAAALSRQGLMAAQVSATVLLIIGALLFARTYLLRVALDKGFASANLVVFDVSPAPDAPVRDRDLDQLIYDRLAGFPGLRSLSRATSPPPATAGGISGPLQIDGTAEPGVSVFVSACSVDANYFETLGVPFVAGAAFTADSRPDQVVVDEAFADRFWPAGNAVGGRFNVGSAGMYDIRKFEIIGVTRHVRYDRDVDERNDPVFPMYLRLLPSYNPPLRFVGRLDQPERFADLVSTVRAIAKRSFIRADFLDDRYARLEGDRRIAASVTTGFGLLALVIAGAGIYAVMAFLVAGRMREIGIRLALGAGPGDVRRATFGASLKFVAAGAALGLAAAVAASRWVESQLYGVGATDAATYGLATGVVIVAALVATWYPARQAARVDPAMTLRM